MTTILKRQFITDSIGNPIGIILPLEEYDLIKDILEQLAPRLIVTDKFDQMEQAAHDLLFMADLQETMAAFDEADFVCCASAWHGLS